MPKQKSQDKTEARGVGLEASEWEEVEKIAQDLGITPHAVYPPSALPPLATVLPLDIRAYKRHNQ